MFLNCAHWGNTRSPSPLFEEADGADEILVHGPVEGNGPGVKVKGLWFLPPLYLHSLHLGAQWETAFPISI